MRQVNALLRSIALAALLALAPGAAGPPLVAQAGGPPPGPALRAALDSARAYNERTLAEQASLCEIPAPPFKESVRAAEMVRRFAALGLRRARLDGIGNVIAEYPGRTRKPLIVLSAHLDTVFPESTDVRVRREGTLLRGPGIADDCRGLAVLLATARALIEAKVPFEGTLLFVATVGEEGLGNGRGVRHLFEKEVPGQVDYFLTVDVNGFQVVNRAAGSRRYEITYRAPGGHSYSDFPMPHPIHALGRAIAKIAGFQVPSDPKTTFNVGIVRGGTAVNAIAETATMVVDLRSESAEELSRLDASLKRAVDEALVEERARWPMSRAPLTVGWDTLGIRPGGIVPETSPMVRMIAGAAQQLGVTMTFGSASTDANIPMSLGIPALAIGHGGEGVGEHSLSETYEDGPAGYRGPQWLLLIAAALDAGGPGTQSSPDRAGIQAISFLGDTLRAFPLSPETRRRYEAQLAEARTAYDRAPTDPDSIVWLGRRLAYLGRLREAIEVYTRGMALHPDNPWLYRHRGHRFITVRELDNAVRDFERARKLVTGKPDQIEPDGQPNPRNQPIGTLHSNILYHLGLTYYLKGDFARAAAIYRNELALAHNDDRRVSTAHWLYMALRRLGREREAAAVLAPIASRMEIVENQTYHQLLLMYKGLMPPDSVLPMTPGGEMSVTDATAAYGIGNWHLYNGRPAAGREIFRRIVAGGQWGAFGFIAAEAELARKR